MCLFWSLTAVIVSIFNSLKTMFLRVLTVRFIFELILVKTGVFLGRDAVGSIDGC